MKNQTYYFDVTFGEKGQLDPDTNRKLHEPCDLPPWVVWSCYIPVVVFLVWVFYKNSGFLFEKQKNDEENATNLVEAVEKAVKARAQASRDESYWAKLDEADKRLRRKAAKAKATSEQRAALLEHEAEVARAESGRSKHVLRLLYKYCNAEQEENEVADEEKDYARLNKLWNGKIKLPAIRRLRPTLTLALAFALPSPSPWLRIQRGKPQDVEMLVS